MLFPKSLRFLAPLAFALALLSCGQSAGTSPDDARKFIDDAEAELTKLAIADNRAQWVHETYINDDTDNLAAAADDRLIARTTELVKESARFDNTQLPADLRRKFLLLKLSTNMPAPADPKLREELTQVASGLAGSYGKGKYCPTPDECVGVETVGERMANSRDPKELTDLWVGWHKVAPPMRDRYARFVELSNMGAAQLGFKDTGALWRSNYDMAPEAFSAELERLWSQVEPLYRELHAYTRTRLKAKYGAAATRDDGMIPAHLLGNIWAQEWGHIYDLVAPPAAPPTYDLNKILAARKTDAKQITAYGENFFKSLGFEPLPPPFWTRSMLTRPADRDVVCHASAWDIDADSDVRLKMCIQGTGEDFTVVHHELGHLYYDLAYRKQPFLFRGAANDGFHEAIGDTIALSITPEYLKTIGLISAVPPAAADIPILLHRALDKVAFLPFGLLIDKWRWQVFSGEVKPADYNKAWWALREKYQGVAAPVDRAADDFDPGAKYHIPANTPYARYFLAAIYQFQFYRAMCREAGYKGPLNRCSFFDSKPAGAKFKAMLELGQSKPWPEAIKQMTGEDKADAGAMVEYFAPLLEWMKEQNKGTEQAGSRVNKTMRRLLLSALLITTALLAANQKLFFTDGTSQVVREFSVQGDRVRYYSVERSDWEEIPVTLVDLKKTEADAKARQELFERQEKEVREEETAVKEERAEIRRIPMDPGVYMLENGQLRIFKLGDWAMRNPKSRTLLKLITPGPMVAGISYMELPGEQSTNILKTDQPEIFLQLSLEDSFGIVKLTPGKGVRQVERVSVEPVTKTVSEERELVKVFMKQLTESGLYKIWPQQPLAKGEYAVIEYTEGKLDTRLWDFRIE